jgi:hypothetical protein
MNDLGSLSGQPRPLTVRIRGEERTYLVHPLMLDELGQLQGWIDAQFPDPFDQVNAAVARNEYTVPQWQFLLECAVKLSTQRRRLIGTPEADLLLQSLEGTIQLLLLAIRKGDPAFGEEQARELRQHLSIGDLERVFSATGASMVMHDPKGGSGASSSNGPPTSRRTRGRRSTGGSSGTRP